MKIKRRCHDFPGNSFVIWFSDSLTFVALLPNVCLGFRRMLYMRIHSCIRTVDMRFSGRFFFLSGDVWQICSPVEW